MLAIGYLFKLQLTLEMFKELLYAFQVFYVWKMSDRKKRQNVWWVSVPKILNLFFQSEDSWLVLFCLSVLNQDLFSQYDQYHINVTIEDTKMFRLPWEWQWYQVTFYKNLAWTYLSTWVIDYVDRILLLKGHVKEMFI